MSASSKASGTAAMMQPKDRALKNVGDVCRKRWTLAGSGRPTVPGPHTQPPGDGSPEFWNECRFALRWKGRPIGDNAGH